jgi:hypothetical protein
MDQPTYEPLPATTVLRRIGVPGGEVLIVFSPDEQGLAGDYMLSFNPTDPLEHGSNFPGSRRTRARVHSSVQEFTGSQQCGG